MVLIGAAQVAVLLLSFQYSLVSASVVQSLFDRLLLRQRLARRPRRRKGRFVKLRAHSVH
jgi:hypothetical protein